MKKSYKFISVILLYILTSADFVTAQERTGKVASKVIELLNQQRVFEPANIFESTIVAENEKASSTIRKYTLLKLNVSALKTITQSGPELLRVSIPSGNARNSTNLLLYKVNISKNGFTLETSDGRRLSELNPIVHYRGIIEGDPKSVVSLSFSKEETMGLICNDEGNYVLGKFEDDNVDAYVFYNDKELVPVFNYECGTNTLNPVQEYKEGNQGNQNPTTMSLKCVDWYYEIDYDIFVGKGSLANVNSYIQGVFNQVSTLYDNDGISITLQTLYVWTATDPYTGPTTSNYLSQFGAYRTSFAGDLANLVGYAGGGGVAYVDGLCSGNSYKMGYMGISSSYNTVPTYSWTVEVVTHEDGHLLGSRHTHDCVWNGNNTRIDNCGPQAGYNSGSCASGPMPSSGTIMSYCHLVGGVGINFNNGFGPQPTALMLDNINTASCLAACTSCPTPPQPGNVTGSTTFCGSTNQSYSITAVSGATSYIWTLPSGWIGTSTSNTINATTSATGGTVSVIAVNSCGNSIARTLTVTANTAPGQPGNLQGSTSVCQGSSQVYTISPISGATTYNWSLPSGWSGSSTSNSITVIPGSNSGNVSVFGVNACGNSSTRTISVTAIATPTQPLSIGGQNVVCINTSYTYTVPTVPGATTYNWALPSGWSGSSSTNTINVVSGSIGGVISVTASNSCGTSNASTFSTSLAIAPARPASISTVGGTKKVCPGDVVSYSISPVPNSTSYTWIAPTGAVISAGQGTNSVSVLYNQGFLAFDTLRVYAINGCAVSQERILRVFRNTPAKPSVISGPVVNGCNVNSVPYVVTNLAGINYNWSFSNNTATVSNGQGSNSITANFGQTSASSNTLSVTASNACGVSAARTLIVASYPGQPGTISGTTTPCANQQGVPYSIAPIAGATSYTWNVPSGARINDGTVTSTTTSLMTASPAVTVNFNTTGGNVRVKSTNACSSSAYRNLAISFGCRMENLESEQLQFSVYPNPANNFVTVQFESDGEGQYIIEFADLTGKIMLSFERESNSEDNQIDISAIPAGVYFVAVKQNENRVIQKLVKL